MPADPERPARLVDEARRDPARLEAATRELLTALGTDLDQPGTRDTPRRMAGAFTELVAPRPFEPTTFPNEDGYDELVLARDITFHSLCMHHALPFFGVAHVAYLPGERIIGLSKLARVVDAFAADLQVQERLTMQIADWLEETLAPRGVGVVLKAEHLCMSIRGVHKPGTQTVTSALRGRCRDDARTRQELFALVA